MLSFVKNWIDFFYFFVYVFFVGVPNMWTFFRVLTHKPMNKIAKVLYMYFF